MGDTTVGPGPTLRNPQSKARLQALYDHLARDPNTPQSAWDQYDSLMDEALQAEGNLQPREGGSAVGNFLAGAASRPAQVALSLGKGYTNLVGNVAHMMGTQQDPERFSRPLQDQSDLVEASTGNSTSANLGRFAGDGALALATGKASIGSLQQLAEAMPRARGTLEALERFGSGGKSTLGRAFRQAAVGEIPMQPLNAAYASNPALSVAGQMDPNTSMGRFANDHPFLTENAAMLGGGTILGAGLGSLFPKLLEHTPRLTRAATPTNAIGAALSQAAPEQTVSPYLSMANVLDDTDREAINARGDITPPPGVQRPRPLTMDNAGRQLTEPTMGPKFADDLLATMRQGDADATMQRMGGNAAPDIEAIRKSLVDESQNLTGFGTGTAGREVRQGQRALLGVRGSQATQLQQLLGDEMQRYAEIARSLAPGMTDEAKGPYMQQLQESRSRLDTYRKQLSDLGLNESGTAPLAARGEAAEAAVPQADQSLLSSQSPSSQSTNDLPPIQTGNDLEDRERMNAREQLLKEAKKYFNPAAIATAGVAAQGPGPNQQPQQPQSQRQFTYTRPVAPPSATHDTPTSSLNPASSLIAVGAVALAGAAGLRMMRNVLREAPHIVPEAAKGAEALIGREVPAALPTGNRVAQRVVRLTAPLERMETQLSQGGVDLATHERPSSLAEQALFGPMRRFHEAAFGSGHVMFDEGKFTPIDRPSLRVIVQRGLSDEDYGYLEPYMLASRLTELKALRPELNLGLGENEYAQLAHTISNAPESVKTAGAKVSQWLDDAFNYWVDAGGFDPDVAKSLQTLYKNYIPIYRLLDESDDALRSAGKGALSIGQQIMRLEGGKGKFAPPLQSVLDYGQRLYRSADQVRIGKAIADAVDRGTLAGMDLSNIAQRVHTAPRIAASEREAFRGLLSSLGQDISDKTLDGLVSSLKTQSPVAEANTLGVWRNGQREYWKVNGEISEALQALTPPQLGLTWRLVGLPSAALRFGVTANPAFTAFNFFRDQFTAYTQSQYGMNPFRGDTLKALLTVARERMGGAARAFTGAGLRPTSQAVDPMYNEWVRAGGGFGLTAEAGGRLESAMAAIPGTLGAKARQNVRVSEVKLLRGVTNVIDLPLVRSWQELWTPFEEATRFAEYKAARKSGASVMEAAKAAQDVTTNFAMRGSSPRIATFSHIIPFFNPAIQSLYRTGEVVAKDPLKYMMKAVAGVTIPTLGLYELNKNDEQINEMRKTPAGAQYWFIRLDADHIMRLPKPFLPGQIFGTMAENAMDRFTGQQPQHASDLLTAVKEQAEPNLEPTIMTLVRGLSTGIDPHFDNPIEPTAESDLQPQFRVRADGSPLVQQLYNKFGATLPGSPAKFEWVLRNLGGRLGMDFLHTMDNVLTKEGPQLNAERQPVIGGMLQDPYTTNNFDQRRFYTDYHLAHEAQRTFNQLQRYRPQDLQTWINTGNNKSLIAAAPAFEAGRRMMTNLRQKIQQINAYYPTAQARELSKPLYTQLTHIAKSYNDVLHSLAQQE